MDNILEALQIFPDNKTAKKYYILISDAIKIQKQSVVDKKSPYFQLYKIKNTDIDALIDNGEYREARVLLEEIVQIFPNISIFWSRTFLSTGTWVLRCFTRKRGS